MEASMSAYSYNQHGRDTHLARHPAQQENSFVQTNLVSDGFVPAAHIDENLINPWGIADSRTGPFWVSDNGTGVTTVYDGNGTLKPIGGHSSITIAARPGQTDPSAPTGQVFNYTHKGFNISSNGHTASSTFIFATEDGTISGWNPTVDSGSSVIAVDKSASDAVYKGLAIGKVHGHTYLYAADFHNGAVDVFNSHFHQVKHFTDPNLPDGYAPFNVQALHGHLFVTFALQDADKEDDVAGPGHGYVDNSISPGTCSTGSPRRDRWTRPGAWPLRRPALGSSRTTSWSETSVMGGSMPMILTTSTSSARWTMPAAIRSSSAICGPSCRAMPARTAIRTASISPQACRTRSTACSEPSRPHQRRRITPWRPRTGSSRPPETRPFDDRTQK